MKTIFFVSLISVSQLLVAQNKWFEIYDNPKVFHQNMENLITDFENQIQNIDPSLSLNHLQVEIKDDLPYGFYSPPENKIYLPLWKTSPQWTKDLVLQILGSEAEEKKLAGLFYNGFFMPHEIAHSFQFTTNTRKDNEFDNEKIANEIALLYWRKMGYHKELEACHTMMKKMLANLDNPFPPEVKDQKKYFTENYQAFVENMPKYMYVQSSQLVSVFEDTTLPDFDTYIAEILQTNNDSSSPEIETETLSGKIETIYSKNYDLRAKTLQHLIWNAAEFYEKKFPASKFTVSLYVLDSDDWQKMEIPFPYGVPMNVYQNDLLLIAAEKDKVAALVGIEDGTPDNVLSDYDYIALHELGHNFFNVVHEIKIPEKWADEFLATYFAIYYLKEVKSDKLLPRADFPDFKPNYTTLEDFDELYFNVGIRNYGWYQDKFQDLALKLYPKHGKRLIQIFLENFNKNASGKKRNSLQILKEMDPIAMKAWFKEMK